MSEETDTIESGVKQASERIAEIHARQKKGPPSMPYTIDDFRFLARVLGPAYRKAYEVTKVAGVVGALSQ